MTPILDAFDAWPGLTDEIILAVQLRYVRYCPTCKLNTLPPHPDFPESDSSKYGICLWCDTKTRKPHISKDPFKKKRRPRAKQTVGSRS